MLTILLLVLALNAFGAPEASFVLMLPFGTVELVKSARTYSRSWPFLLLCGLVLIGLPGFLEHPLYDAFKDLWYFSKPIVELSFGVAVAKRCTRDSVVRLIVGLGVVVSLWYLVRIGLEWDLYLQLSTTERSDASDFARMYFGSGDFLSLLAAVLAIDELSRGPAKLRRSVVAVICVLSAAALLLAQSRTLILLFFVYAGFHFLRSRLKLKLILAVAIAVAVGLVSMLSQELSSESRFRNPIQELTIQEYDSPEDINLNWRGFESFLALQEFSNFDGIRMLVGGGFGQMVTLDQGRQLGTEVFEEIPILHNGFLYVLIKTGIAGLTIYLLWLWLILVKFDWRSSFIATPTFIPFWLCIIIASTTFVITGPYNYSALRTVMILLGFYLHPVATGRQISPARADDQ